jgi:hypothetical protein
MSVAIRMRRPNADARGVQYLPMLSNHGWIADARGNETVCANPARHEEVLVINVPKKKSPPSPE